MSDQQVLHDYFVRVTTIKQKGATFKRVDVSTEVGYWMYKFAFNIFEGHPLYESIRAGDKLRVKVNTITDFAKAIKLSFVS